MYVFFSLPGVGVRELGEPVLSACVLLTIFAEIFGSGSNLGAAESETHRLNSATRIRIPRRDLDTVFLLPCFIMIVM